MSDATYNLEGVLEWVRTAKLSVPDRVEIVRALRDSVADLVPVDSRLRLRIRSAQAFPPEFIHTTCNALESSEVWQQSSSTTPEKLRRHGSFADEHYPLYQEVQVFAETLKYNLRYQHFLAVEMARRAYRIGKEMTGEASLSVRPFVTMIGERRPALGRRRRRTKEQP